MAEPLSAIVGAPLQLEIEGRKLHRIGIAEIAEFRDWVAMQPVRRAILLIQQEQVTDVTTKQILLDRAYKEYDKLTAMETKQFESLVTGELKTPSGMIFLIYKSIAKGDPKVTYSQVASWMTEDVLSQLTPHVHRIMGTDPQNGQSPRKVTLAGMATTEVGSGEKAS